MPGLTRHPLCFIGLLVLAGFYVPAINVLFTNGWGCRVKPGMTKIIGYLTVNIVIHADYLVKANICLELLKVVVTKKGLPFGRPFTKYQIKPTAQFVNAALRVYHPHG
jgi:hypothetical protein